MLVLLAAMLPTAWASANWKVSIATMQHGSVVSSHTTADAGEQVTLTVVPNEYCHLKYGSLVVENTTSDDSDHPVFASRRAPSVGSFVRLSQTDTNTYTFEMPDNDVIVSALFYEEGGLYIDVDTEGGAQGDKIRMEVEPDYDSFTATVNIVEQSGSRAPVKIYLPKTITDAGGNVFQLTTIASFAFYGQTNITDIYLPETEEPLTIEPHAFLLDNETGDSHHIAVIHAPLVLLDDYALMEVFEENYLSSKMMGTVTAQHRYRTFSCGVDAKIPVDVTAYTVSCDATMQVEVNSLGSGITIKANNGVLLGDLTDDEHHYEVTAIPSNDRPSGMTPPTENAQSYPDNQLIPVVEIRHFYAQRNYYILRNNQFFPISAEDADKCCPASKAILRIPNE